MDTNKVKGGELGKKVVRFWDCLLDRGMFKVTARVSAIAARVPHFFARASCCNYRAEWDIRFELRSPFIGLAIPLIVPSSTSGRPTPTSKTLSFHISEVTTAMNQHRKQYSKHRWPSIVEMLA